jgi:hypothetical protein
MNTDPDIVDLIRAGMPGAYVTEKKPEESSQDFLERLEREGEENLKK